MCFSAELSKKSLIFGIASGLALMSFGESKYKENNMTIGFFFIFVSLMQYVEYLIWNDLECKTDGANKFAGTIGFLLNYLQPTMLLLLSLYFIKNKNITKDDALPIIINAIYFCYIMNKFRIYMKTDTCSAELNGHLEWVWRDYDSYLYFHIVLLINIFCYMMNLNGAVAFSISYLYMFISKYNYSKHVGEFWCLLVTTIPSLILLLQKTIL